LQQFNVKQTLKTVVNLSYKSQRSLGWLARGGRLSRHGINSINTLYTELKALTAATHNDHPASPCLDPSTLDGSDVAHPLQRVSYYTRI